jgi:hypothetical protein
MHIYMHIYMYIYKKIYNYEYDTSLIVMINVSKHH